MMSRMVASTTAAIHSAVRGTEAAATNLLYGDDNNAGHEFYGEHFYRRFSLGKKVTQGAATNVYEATPNTRRLRAGAARGGGREAVRRYAVKRVRKWQLREQKKQDLLREVDILRRLDHPNVVTIHQFYRKDPKNFYVVLESLAGGELFDRIVKKGSYNEREARDVCNVLVGVVGHLHDRGIVHRDLKPASILLPASSAEGDDATANGATVGTTTSTSTSTSTTTNGSITTTTVTTVVTTTTYNDTGCLSLKLTDFGMARCVRGGPVKSDGGVNEFKPPEILLGKDHGKPVDMWSLGCLAYILLSGKHPFYEPDSKKMFLRVAAGDCEFKPEGCWRNTSKDAKDFIERLLTVDVDSRMTVEQAKMHPWLSATPQSLEAHDLNKNLEEIKIFNAKRKLRTAMKTVLAAKRLLSGLPAAAADFSSSYTLGRKLGEGSFGMVFKATRASANAGGHARSSWVGRESPPAAAAAAASFFAVKRISKRGLDDIATDEVINEANIMRELNHPNVVSIYDFYQEDPDYFYMVLEFMEGGELFGRIVKKEYYNEAEARDVCCILLGAVSYIHSQGIVHRDLKPENLLLASPSDDTSIRLADFGFASSVRDGHLINACGTPGYVAPEMLKNLPYKTSVDVWSVGVIIYVLLAGYPPFHDRDQKKMFRAIRGGHFKFHDKYWSEVSPEAKDLITKLLTVDPEARITASEACQHPWLTTARPQLSENNLSAGLEKLKIFNAIRKFRVAIKSVIAAKQLASVLGMARPS